MTNYQSGFIQIPILIMVVIGAAVLGGTGYVAYEVGQHSSNKNADEAVAATTMEETSDSVATTTSDVNSTSTDSTDIEATGETSTKVTTNTDTVKTAPVENFNQVVIAFIDSRLDYERQVIDYIQEYANYSEKYYKAMSNMEYQMGLITGNSNEDEAFMNYIGSHVNSVKVYYDGFQGMVDRLEADVAYYQNQRTAYLNKFVTREESISLSTKISNLSQVNEYFDFSGDFYDDLVDVKDTFDSNMEMVFALQEAKYDSKSSYSSTYIPAPTPQIQKPSVTSTHCSVYGDTISCDTYQNLY